ncbi:MAG: hypothetical protein L0H25_00095 [Micrococcales bacterium]|nr:hypothetical protein [Micrococcales bacterium]
MGPGYAFGVSSLLSIGIFVLARRLSPPGILQAVGKMASAVVFTRSRPQDGSVMSMQPKPGPKVPSDSFGVAKRARRRGALAA